MIELALTYLGIGQDKLFQLMEYYNEHCYPLVCINRRYKIQHGDNWCAMFTSVIAHKSGLTINQFPFEVSVEQQVKIAKDKGCFNHDIRAAKRGDLIIYNMKRNGAYNHVGFVISVEGGFVTTVEGNYSHTVKCRQVPIFDDRISGCIKVG